MQIQNAKIDRYIKKKIFNVRNTIPILLSSTVASVLEVNLFNLFVHVRFGKDNQRPYSKKKFLVLQYEEITSTFLLFQHCLDISGRIVFNHCDKYLLPLISNNVYSKNGLRKVKEVFYISAVKLIRRLVITTCQNANFQTFIGCYNTYENGVH